MLIAAGPWADRLLDPLGYAIGLTPYKSQVVIFRWPMAMDQGRTHRVVIDTIQESWLRPEGDAGTLIGIEFPDRMADPDTFPEFPPVDYIEKCRSALAARFPVFANSTMRGGWTGMYMMSPDHHPIIGKLDQAEGLYVMTGDSGSCFKTAPATGVCLAELMTEGEAKLVDLAPFRPSRFAEGKPWVDEHRYGEVGESSASPDERVAYALPAALRDPDRARRQPAGPTQFRSRLSDRHGQREAVPGRHRQSGRADRRRRLPALVSGPMRHHTR